MAKQTLLSMTQNILSALTSDEVNSITDTVEALEVADVIRETYDDLITNKVIPEHQELFTLTALGDSNRPNYMQVPSDVDRIDVLKYNVINSGDTAKDYNDIIYLTPMDFLDRILTRNSDDTNVDIISDASGVELLIKNDKDPEYYTSFNDVDLVFDAYDSAVDTTLQSSKTVCWGVKIPTWTHTDAFIPDMPSDMFPKLLAEAKSVCFINQKQTPNAKEEQKSKRQSVRLQKDKWKVGYDRTSRNYGRKR